MQKKRGVKKHTKILNTFAVQGKRGVKKNTNKKHKTQKITFSVQGKLGVKNTETQNSKNTKNLNTHLQGKRGVKKHTQNLNTFAGKHKKISTHICRESEDSEVSSDSEDEWRELHNYSATPYWPDD